MTSLRFKFRRLPQKYVHLPKYEGMSQKLKTWKDNFIELTDSRDLLSSFISILQSVLFLPLSLNFFQPLVIWSYNFQFCLIVHIFQSHLPRYLKWGVPLTNLSWLICSHKLGVSKIDFHNKRMVSLTGKHLRIFIMKLYRQLYVYSYLLAIVAMCTLHAPSHQDQAS